MSITIDGQTYDVDRDDLALLIDRGSSAAWVARALLDAADDEPSRHRADAEGETATG